MKIDSIRLISFRFLAPVLISCICACSNHNRNEEVNWPDKVSVILANTSRLEYSNENRLPLYLWPAIDPGDLSLADAVTLISELDKRGIATVSSWSMDDTSSVMKRALTIAKAQKKLGLRVNINATELLYSFFNGDESTAHIDESGNRYFDSSFGKKKMGCPFTLDMRKAEIRKRVEMFVDRYKQEGVDVDFIFADWEIDGPIEVNGAYAASGKCVTCNKWLGDGFTFSEFQKKMREMRSFLQYYSLADPVLRSFPDALAGNYAVYPNDGYRYWYDYFEQDTENYPYKADQRAKYREWFNDFPLTGFTIAMPVVYPWAKISGWYDFENTDYRWFYNMLLNASNAGRSTPSAIPIISFVHRHTVFEDGEQDSTVAEMSSDCYMELLWHMLLRGTDTFFMWSEPADYPEEISLVHKVYSEAQQYGDYLEHGIPVTFDVPDKPATIVSGLMLGDSVLVRRSDFTSDHDPVSIMAGTTAIIIEYNPGNCKIIPLKKD